ncbi:MAG: hypothetical protein OCD03_15395 [Hyphomicrobiales bacterium]
MTKNLPLLGAVLLLVIAYITGFSKYLGLAWYGQATLIGGAAGVLLTLALTWVMSKNPAMAKWLPILILTDFIMAVGFTYYFARIFIDSANFESTAGFIWYIGYHVAVALFVPLATFALQKILAR